MSKEQDGRARDVRYRVPANVAWVSGPDTFPDDLRFYLMVVPDGPPAVLDGTAALVWDLAMSGMDVLPELAALTGQPVDAIAEDVERFLDDLATRGLLELDGGPMEER